MASQWRDEARKVIARAIAEGRASGLDGAALRKHVSAAYPFGERAMHPYRIWLDEMRRQLKDWAAPAEDLSRYWIDLAFPGKGS